MSTRGGLSSLRAAVIGGGAFGGWTALELARRGADVTLIDAWGPGNARASSGGETRVMRATYGTRGVYTALAARALRLWQEHDERFDRAFFRKTGALWLVGADDAFARASGQGLEAHGLPHEWLTTKEAARRYPQFAYDGIAAVLYEEDAGYLLARRACEHVAECVAIEGGAVRTGAVRGPVRIEGSPLKRIALEDGSHLDADVFIFACGPWLGALFPDVIGASVTPTRQEVYYFGTPAGDERFSGRQLPVWLDLGDVSERLFYGIPGNANRGFKLSDDTPGDAFDPTNGSREITPDGIAAARAFLSRRFPALANAPLLGGEVCQYEASPDSHFIVDRHPGAANVWIAGGGSGHGFKMGPALGELLAEAVVDGAVMPAAWRLARFEAGAPAVEKWS